MLYLFLASAAVRFSFSFALHVFSFPSNGFTISKNPGKLFLLPPVDFSPVLRCCRATSSLLSIRCISRRLNIVYFRLENRRLPVAKAFDVILGPEFSLTQICFPLVVRIKCCRLCCQLLFI